MLYGHGASAPVIAIVLLASSLFPLNPSCSQTAKVLFDGMPLVAECRVERDELVYTVRVKPERKRSLSSLALSFRGVIRSVAAPKGWSVKRERGSDDEGTKIAWEAPQSEQKWKGVREPIAFTVVVSGPEAGLGCSEGYSYARRNGTEGGINGCPIG